MFSMEAWLRLYTRRSSATTLMWPIACGQDRLHGAKHVQIGAAVIVFCRVRSWKGRATAGEPLRTRYNRPHWYLEHAQPAGRGVRCSLRLLRSLGQPRDRSRPGITQIPPKPHGEQSLYPGICKRSTRRWLRGWDVPGRSAVRERGETSQSSYRWRVVPRVEPFHWNQSNG